MGKITAQILSSIVVLIGLAWCLVIIGSDSQGLQAFGFAMQLPQVIGLLIAVPSAVVLLCSLLDFDASSPTAFFDKAKPATFAFLIGMSFLNWGGAVALVALVIASSRGVFSLKDHDSKEEKGPDTSEAEEEAPKDWACLFCGSMVPADNDKCQKCGWTWGEEDQSTR